MTLQHAVVFAKLSYTPVVSNFISSIVSRFSGTMPTVRLSCTGCDLDYFKLVIHFKKSYSSSIASEAGDDR